MFLSAPVTFHNKRCGVFSLPHLYKYTHTGTESLCSSARKSINPSFPSLSIFHCPSSLLSPVWHAGSVWTEPQLNPSGETISLLKDSPSSLLNSSTHLLQLVTCQGNTLQSCGRVIDLVFSHPSTAWWCCRSHILVWVAHVGGTWMSPQAACYTLAVHSTGSEFFFDPSQFTDNDVKSDGLCSFLRGDSLQHHCILYGKWHKAFWIHLLRKILWDPGIGCFTKKSQPLGILRLILTSFVLILFSCKSVGPGPPLTWEY